MWEDFGLAGSEGSRVGFSGIDEELPDSIPGLLTVPSLVPFSVVAGFAVGIETFEDPVEEVEACLECICLRGAILGSAGLRSDIERPNGFNVESDLFGFSVVVSSFLRDGAARDSSLLGFREMLDFGGSFASWVLVGLVLVIEEFSGAELPFDIWLSFAAVSATAGTA